MKEEQRLLDLDLQKEQEKQSLSQPEGIKLYLFRALYSLLQNHGLNHFCDILFTIFSFVQLMAFPMDTIFSSGWKTYWYGTVGSFFRYFQLISLWEGNTQFYIITYIIACLYILILLISFVHILYGATTLPIKSKFSNKLIASLLEFEIVLNIPFLRTLIAVFTCENDNLKIAPDFKCKSGIHISLIILSIIFSLIYVFIIILFHSTLFEFGTNNGKLKSAYTSSTEVTLDIIKLILILLYQFINNDLILSIITFILSFIIFVDFLNKQPFSNGFTMKLYFGLYLLFFWSCTICIISILLKNSKFEGGCLLLIIGFPIIIFSISTKQWDYSFDKIFEYAISKNKDGYNALLEIEFFLKLEDSLEDKIRTREQKVLYSYINNYEKNCTIEDCPLKQFLNIPLKVENFVEMKICLLQHAETLYKNAISKYPFNAKLRISYGLFLFKKLNKKLKGTNEITLLNKYNTNLEDSFLVYKAQRFIREENDGLNAANDLNEIQNKNITDSITYKIILNNIKTLIGTITMNYIDFWTILAINEENKSENFQKMSKIGTKIRKLNEELLENVEKLENVNIYDQDTVKLYIQYLTEILSDNTQANIYNNKLAENEQKKHQYNEENLFELDYKAMSKSEDYKYIVISCSPPNFGNICNLSLSVCPIFGYTKEELIGHPFEYLIPELFCYHKKMILKDKVDEFKKKLIIKNVKIHSDSWIDDSFGRNKMKYLVPFKVRWTLVSSEEEVIYCIGKIIPDNKTIMELEQEIAYVLTDKDLIIQSFTSNAPKLLYLHSSAINNNLDITDFILEFNEDSASNIDNLDDIKESIISSMSIITSKKRAKNLKSEILKKMFLIEKETKKIIHWRIGDNFINEINKGTKKSGIFAKRASFSKTNFNESRFQSALLDNIGNILNKPKIKVIPKRKISLNTAGDTDSLKNKKLNFSNVENKLPNYEHEKIIDFDANILEMHDPIDKNIKDKLYYHGPIQHKFMLTVNEVKFNDCKVGYLFKFEPHSTKVSDEANISNINKNNKYTSKNEFSSINKQDINEIEKSEISVISFSAKQNLEQRNSLLVTTTENPFGISCENDDGYFMKINKEKENEFTIDINNMVYKQLGINCFNEKSEEIVLYEKLRQEAIEKISKASKQEKKEDDSKEEEDSSSGSYYSNSEDSSKNSSEFSSNEKNDEQSLEHSIKEVNSKEMMNQKKNENNINNDNKNNSIKEINNNIPIITISPSQKQNNLNLN